MPHFLLPGAKEPKLRRPARLCQNKHAKNQFASHARGARARSPCVHLTSRCRPRRSRGSNGLRPEAPQQARERRAAHPLPAGPARVPLEAGCSPPDGAGASLARPRPWALRSASPGDFRKRMQACGSQETIARHTQPRSVRSALFAALLASFGQIAACRISSCKVSRCKVSSGAAVIAFALALPTRD